MINLLEVEYYGIVDKLKEVELKYLFIKEEKEKVEKDLKNIIE